MTFRDALLAKAGPSMFSIVAVTPSSTSNCKLKKIVLKNFSDMGTAGEASKKLSQMRMSEEQPIVYHNNQFTAIHEVAFDLTPEEQCMRFVLNQYTETLSKQTAMRLNGKIVKEDSKIRTLRDAMSQAVIIDEESRNWVAMKKRRNSNNKTTIDATVNEISDIDINYVSTKYGDNRFNNTMKNNYSL